MNVEEEGVAVAVDLVGLGKKEGSGGMSSLTSVQASGSLLPTLSLQSLKRVIGEAHVRARVTFKQLTTTGDLDRLDQFRKPSRSFYISAPDAVTAPDLI